MPHQHRCDGDHKPCLKQEVAVAVDRKHDSVYASLLTQCTAAVRQVLLGQCQEKQNDADAAIMTSCEGETGRLSALRR